MLVLKFIYQQRITFNNHLNWFWYQLKQKPDLRNVLIDWFPNPKEQTESVAMLVHAEKYAKLENALVLIAGDGQTPRTGLLFALLYSTCIVKSIDPIMKLDDTHSLPNLRRCKTTMEEFITASKQEWEDCSKSIVLVFPHSHANIYVNVKEIIETVSRKINIYIISMPCCFLDLQTLTI